MSSRPVRVKVNHAFTAVDIAGTFKDTHHDLPLRVIPVLRIFRIGLQLRCESSEHSGSENNGGTAARRQHDGHAAGIGEQLHEGDVLGLATGHVNGGDLVAFGVHLVNNVTRLESNTL